MLKITKPYADYYIGTTREIKSLERNLYAKTNYVPLFSDEPKFNPDRMYGIEVDFGKDGDEQGKYFILGETDVVYLLMGEVQQMKHVRQIVLDLDMSLNCLSDSDMERCNYLRHLSYKGN